MSASPRDFELATTPLPSGVTLLEASAGTGKTFTLCGIVTRLVAVEGLPIGRILVVTFTEAATHELRDRIRHRLRETEKSLNDPGSVDPLVLSLRASGVAPDELQRRVRLAMASFDEACIATIHGFCRQVLRDNAFDSELPVDAEVLIDPGGLQRELAEDFWRHHLQAADPLLATLARRQSLLPADLARLLARITRQPGLRLLPEATGSLPMSSAAVTSGCQAALAAWPEARGRVTGLLRSHPGLSRDKSTGLSETRIDEMAAWLDDATASGVVTTAAIDALCELSAASIADRHKPSAKVRYPADAWHESCGVFAVACEQWTLAVRAAWLAFAAQESGPRKSARKVITFDDMLAYTHAALVRPQGEGLVAAIRQRWQAALIDEFQDTDALQYAIFWRCFATPTHRLMLIGDPKQAIYGFRGADLFTYLKAKREVATAAEPRLFTLRRNFRSSRALVDAVNAVFTRTPACFMQEGIEFLPAIGDGGRAAQSALTQRGVPVGPPLSLVTWPAAVTADEARQLIALDIAAEIQRMLLAGYQLGDRALAASDIAVLVRKHDEAVIVQEALRVAEITSVRRTGEGVFDTVEATELTRILEALLEPARPSRLKGALAGAFFGFGAVEILALDDAHSRHGELVEIFDNARQRWQRYGFAAAFRELLITFDVHARLVGESGGERRLTNFLHLAELLHRAERAERLPPAALLQWLRTQRQAAITPPEDVLQRLERDEDAVQIVTVHNSKGLEYPIVFCASHWSEPYVREAIFHDPAADDRLTLDLSQSGSATHKQRALAEQLAEDVRLLYVSLTRAVHRCTLYLYRPSRSKTSALRQVLGDDLLAAAADLAAALPTLCERRELHPSPPAAVAWNAHRGSPLAGFRSPSRTPEQIAMVGSFTRFVAGAADAADEVAQDHDAGGGEAAREPVDEPVTAVDPIFELAAGAATGTALHGVMEQVDFTQPQSLGPLVARHFAPLNLDEGMQAVVTRQLTRLLEHPLPAGEQTIRLRDIPCSARAAEVEFYYPIRGFTAAELAAVCSRRGRAIPPGVLAAGHLERLRFDPVDGFLRGFIDSIVRCEGRYFLIDWKSNRLGRSTLDYQAAQLQAAMRANFYDLQSWLYAVALDRHLRLRLRDYRYEDHFGGILYVFVRGLDPADPARGVYFERPEQKLLTSLAATLFSSAEDAA